MTETAAIPLRKLSTVSAFSSRICWIKTKRKKKLPGPNFFRAIDAGDPAALDQEHIVDYADHNPQFPNLPSGIEGVRQGFEISLGAWSNFHHEVVDQIAEGDKVVSQINAYAIHIGEFLGVPATHKEITMSGIAVHRVANGRLVEHWANIDQVGVLEQLGVLPKRKRGT